MQALGRSGEQGLESTTWLRALLIAAAVAVDFTVFQMLLRSLAS